MDRRNFIIKAALTVGALGVGSRAFAQNGSNMGFPLPALPYAPESLAPHIDAKTMRIHHGKHHAGYTAKLNAEIECNPELQNDSIEEILMGLPRVSDAASQTRLRNNGGGYYNHRLFWEIMAPEGKTGSISPELRESLNKSFGSMKKFQEAFSNAALTQFGSGWAWLIFQDDKLIVTSTSNQDNPLMKGIVVDKELGTPILGVDVWEHAYYLNYQNRRGDYLAAWWNIVNWDRVSQNFAAV